MLENYSIYAEKTEAILKEIERHSFVVDPDTRVVEMSIAQDAVEDAFNYAEERKIKIKPLKFKNWIANTPIGDFEMKFKSFEFEVWRNNRLIDVFFRYEDAYTCANNRYIKDVKQCLELSECDLINTPVLHPMKDISKELVVRGYNEGNPFIPLYKIAEILNLDGYLGRYTSFSASEDIISFSIWGEWVVDLDYSLNIVRSEANHSTAISFSMSIEIIDLLNQWHFDYRGLIEKGLAIDINTINKHAL